MDAQRLQVLLISAREDDLAATRDLLGLLGVGVDLHRARGADDALRFFSPDGGIPGAAAPDLVLLDLALAGDGALAVLKALRDHPGPARTQVVAITDDDDAAELEMIAPFPIHDTARRPFDRITFERVIAYFGEL